MSEIAKKGWENYMWQLKHHPLPTKAVTAGVLSGISDAAAQKLSGGQKLQLKRLLLRTLFGFAYFGPVGHYKHILLDKIFKGRNDKKTVAKKVIVDQLTASPWNNLVFMMYYGYIVEANERLTNKGLRVTNLKSLLTTILVIIIPCLRALISEWKTMARSPEKNQKGFSLFAVHIMDVLASCRLDKFSVHANSISCCVPELCCVLLGDIS